MNILILCPAYSPSTSTLAEWCVEYSRDLSRNGMAAVVLQDKGLERGHIVEHLQGAQEPGILVYIGHGRESALIRRTDGPPIEESPLLDVDDLLASRYRHVYGICCHAGTAFGPAVAVAGGTYLGFWHKCHLNLMSHGDEWRRVLGIPLQGCGSGFTTEHHRRLRKGLESLKRLFLQRMSRDPAARLHAMALIANLTPGNLRFLGPLTAPDGARRGDPGEEPIARHSVR